MANMNLLFFLIYSKLNVMTIYFINALDPLNSLKSETCFCQCDKETIYFHCNYYNTNLCLRLWSI